MQKKVLETEMLYQIWELIVAMKAQLWVQMFQLHDTLAKWVVAGVVVLVNHMEHDVSVGV